MLRSALRVFLAVTILQTLALSAYAATRTPDVDDCMLTYARQLLNGTATHATVYDNGNGTTHVDTATLPLPVIGKSAFCTQSIPGKPLEALINSHYCAVAVAYVALTQ